MLSLVVFLVLISLALLVCAPSTAAARSSVINDGLRNPPVSSIAIVYAGGSSFTFKNKFVNEIAESNNLSAYRVAIAVLIGGWRNAGLADCDGGCRVQNRDPRAALPSLVLVIMSCLVSGRPISHLCHYSLLQRRHRDPRPTHPSELVGDVGQILAVPRIPPVGADSQHHCDESGDSHNQGGAQNDLTCRD